MFPTDEKGLGGHNSGAPRDGVRVRAARRETTSTPGSICWRSAFHALRYRQRSG